MASTLEPFSPAAAEAYRRTALQLEEQLRRIEEEVISPLQAEKEGICDAETVRRAVREGRVENVGTRSRIGVRRGEVAGKARRRGSIEEIAREMVRTKPKS